MNSMDNDALESELQDHEMFISRTDKKGIIISGNSVFFRVSEYAKSELIGRPHNTIRHPKMPKAVFKLFWDTIKQDEMIAAYVLNRSKNGKYYWVLAFAFPTADGYISIRIKPRTPLKKFVEGLYNEMLQIEKSEGVEASLDFFNQQLKQKNFSSYKHFMAHILIEEFKVRDREYLHKIDSSGQMGFLGRIHEIQKLTSEASASFVQACDTVGKFYQSESLESESIKQFSKVFERLDYLSFNMSIVAHRLGKLGGTLSVVASNFQFTARQVVRQYEIFRENLKLIQKNLEENTISICCSRLQSEMLFCFSGEIIGEQNSIGLKNTTLQSGWTSDLVNYIQNIQALNLKSSPQQIQFYTDLVNLKKETSKLLNLVVRLDLIKTGGKLEGSRTVEVLQAFQPFIDEMTHFVHTVHGPIETLLSKLADMCTSFEKVTLSVGLTEYNLAYLVKIGEEMLMTQSEFQRRIAV